MCKIACNFSNKAETLKSLQGQLCRANIAEIVHFSVSQWQDDADKCLAACSNLGYSLWIVRSSCQREDNSHTSNAGAFLSLPDIPTAQIAEAVEQVIASYGEADAEDQVLIQPMLKNVIRSGVAFSHDPNNAAPYRIINWHEGNDTCRVTGGLGGEIWRHAAEAPISPPKRLKPVIDLLNELLNIFDQTPIDLEFAVTQEQEQEKVWLLQVRPLLLSAPPDSNAQQQRRLSIIAEKVARGIKPHPFLCGRRTVYGVMPDWNPAEIIGVRPKPLALSLYRELVTDSIWAYQRHNYGYRNLRSFPLMPHFLGLPYIDVRLSFNSFIPANLDEGIAQRLVDEYIDRLVDEPSLHDKVEFDIVFSCYTLDLDQRLERLRASGFSRQETGMITQSLRELTNRIIHPKTGLWRQDQRKIATLNQRREKLLTSSADALERIYWLLEDGKRYGTLPFAGLARVGFIAVQFLKSLINIGVLTTLEYEQFIGSVKTISGQLSQDRALLDKHAFLSRYGHLRPGTYDILSYRYDEQPDLYFDWDTPQQEPRQSDDFSLTLTQMQQIAKLLKEHGLHSDVVELFAFLKTAIEQREMSKFHFTRNLSDILLQIGLLGERYGFSREEMSYCDISAIKEMHIAAIDPRSMLESSIRQGQAQFQETLVTVLPPLITKPEDVWSFNWPDTEPNFITQKRILGPVTTNLEPSLLNQAIVAIPNADPGYDWLFSHPIAGLITAWGGANSHMAIRAGELGLPTVIGAGENNFQKWSTAQRLHIDCAARQVEILA